MGSFALVSMIAGEPVCKSAFALALLGRKQCSPDVMMCNTSPSGLPYACIYTVHSGSSPPPELWAVCVCVWSVCQSVCVPDLVIT